MKKIKEYEIDSFEKLCNVVTKENVKRLGFDLIGWLVIYAEAIELFRSKYPDYKNYTNWQLAKGLFIWVDDGNNQMLGFTFVNKDTGEKTKINLK